MRSSGRRDLLVFLGFAAVSFGYFGWPLLPHPGRAILGSGADPEIFVWSFAWWPHAILHWTNPFVTHALFAPSGADLVWVTSVPGLALVFSPITLALGPVLSFNLAGLLLPALAAWSAYRLCDVLTGSLWASLVGGYLFGFSSFVLAQQLQGHLNLTGTFVLPLVALCIVRFTRGEWSGRRFAVVFGALMAVQLSISTEVALTLTLMLVLGLLLVLLLARDARPAVRALVPSLAAGYALGAVLAAPLVVYALLHFPHQGFSGGQASGTDLANLLFPTGVNGIAGSAFPSVEKYLDLHESAIYLGLPTLLIVVLFAWRAWRRGWGRFLIAGLLVSLVLALGARLLVAGRHVAQLPWALLDGAPGLDNVHAPRFAEFASLAAAVIVALWTAQARGRVFRRPYVLPLLAVAALVPAAWKPLAVTHPDSPAFFTGGLYRSCFPANETVAIFPFPGDSDLYQTEAGFWFRLAGGYLQAPAFGEYQVIGFNDDPTVYELEFYGDRGLPSVDALLAFADRHRVSRFVSVVGNGYPTETQMRAFGPVQQIGGVDISPACGRPPLTAHPLPAGAELVKKEQQERLTIEYCLDGYDYELPAGLSPAALLNGATKALFIAGHGLRCSAPTGYKRHGSAPAARGVPADTYPYYTR